MEGGVVEQLLVPKPYISRVLYLAHSHLLGAHLRAEKTYKHILRRFYWPGVKRAVEEYCRQCATCQKTSPKVNYHNPLVPLPITETPFHRIAMDIMGPLPKSSRGHRYILVILDYATRYPEAIPLRAATAKAVARETFLLFSRVGIVEEILTDQGTCFMSKVLKEMCKLLKVSQIRTSVYHPQTDGLVERFNQTLKQMLRKVIEVDGKNWDQLLPYVLFSIREVPQSSTGFSPFELLYGRRPRGMMDIAKEVWENQPSPHRSVVEHVEQMHQRMTQVWPIVREHMKRAQEAQARVYNRGAQLREFQPGEKVMVLVPTHECKFLAKWHGPYEVVERVGPVNYKIRQLGRRRVHQIYHINLLKKWYEPEQCLLSPLSSQVSSQEPVEVEMGAQLSPTQKQDLLEMVSQHSDVFSLLPGRTTVVYHDIVTEPGRKVRLKPYRIPEAQREAIREEVRKMLALNIIEESSSAWSSPIVLVPKPDGSVRFCNDFRKLNEISCFDAYPMPRVDELIERLGPARFVSTLDLTKGYWQVPFTDQAKEKTEFSTPDGLFQYRVLLFGVHGAPPTFQRMMDKILQPHQEYAAAYLDDIVVHSADWSSHLSRLRAMLSALREAGLTANPTKCKLGLEEAEYLGFTIGRGNVRPQKRKTDTISKWPKPVTKKQVKTFLGLVGYYRQFIPNFATLAAPLHDLTKNHLPHHVVWSAEVELAFSSLKQALGENPVLITPDFQQPFIVQTDASETGLGAVFSQQRNGEEHPIMFNSRKLLKHEHNYSTVEKECLAIRWVLKKLRYYLLGREFTLITDHAPLKWMSTAKDSNARVTRWFLDLQDFCFRVEHRSGKLQGNVDALSRREECLWSVAPGNSLELRGGVCGKPMWEGETPDQRSRPRLGKVINHEYFHLLTLQTWNHSQL
uniref:Gypsy retrotransposon integrase-like protein 1 n=1 Tax=Cyprinus carpio TaxID=7962 RepID=A0A8C1GXK8_CYPCA